MSPRSETSTQVARGFGLGLNCAWGRWGIFDENNLGGVDSDTHLEWAWKSAGPYLWPEGMLHESAEAAKEPMKAGIRLGQPGDYLEGPPTLRNNSWPQV